MVAVFGFVGRVEVASTGGSAVDVIATGEKAEVRIAFECVDLAVVRDQQRNLKFERDDDRIRGLEMSVVIVVALLGDDGPQTAFVAVPVAVL